MTCLWPVYTTAVNLLLATDDTPGNPWIMGGGKQFQTQRPGIEIELYRLMAERLNLQLEMIRRPWKRCLSELKHGRIDGVFPASFKPERSSVGVYPTKNSKVDPSRKSRQGAYYLYRQKASPLDWDGQAFLNLNRMDRKTIGVPLDWSIAADLRRMGLDLLHKPRPMDLLAILNKGGLAGVVCLDTVIDTYLAQAPTRFKQIQKVYPPVAEKAYYLILSHAFVTRHPYLSEKIWNTIAAIKAEERFKAIIDRYIH